MPARYPEIVDYNEAVQNPATAFRDPELRQGHIDANALGLPIAFSGGFALTYMMRAARRKLAVRCFLREIPAVQQKYAAIAGAFRTLNSRYFVDFQYLADGIAVQGGRYPLIKMDWAEGETLGVWLERHHRDAGALARLRQAFSELAEYLEQIGVGHGDIQTGNVIVSPEGLRLVDYDGVYVPGMPAEFASESGHRHFQHPLRTTASFGPNIDRFSFIVVDLSLAALIEDASLYPRFCRGGEAIILHANDFADPNGSQLLRMLAQHPGLAVPVRQFAAICAAKLTAVPSLADFRAGRNIPRAAAPRPPATAAAPSLGAANRNLVARLIGGGNTGGRSGGAAAPPPHAAPPSHRPASPAPPPAVANSAILRQLRTAPPQPPLPPRPAPPQAPATIRPAALRPPQPAATAPAAAPAAVPAAAARPPRRRMIPRAGSFVIHPRLQRSTAAAAATEAAAMPPGAWQRLRRLLGFGS